MTTTEPEIYSPHRNIAIDTMFWQHHSIFAGTQEQLDELRRDADRKAGMRYRDQLLAAVKPKPASIYDSHRPAVRRLKGILHVGLIPLLWFITTCRCGDRWPCNEVKQHIRHQHGWTGDITAHLKALTKRLRKDQVTLARLNLRSLSPSANSTAAKEVI